MIQWFRQNLISCLHMSKKKMSKLLIILIFPLSIDVLSLYLSLKKNRRGRGASGFPIITLFIYGLLIFHASYPSNISIKVLLCLLTFLIHITLVFVIPLIDRQRRIT